MTNNEMILKLALNNKENCVITGLEGIRKSLGLIEHYLVSSDINYIDDEAIIYACKSFKMLKEKQEYIMEEYNLTEFEVPIIGMNNSDYTHFHTNKTSPETIYRETKIVLCSQSYVTKLNHINLNSKNVNKKFIKAIIFDEFDFSSGIIPSLSYLQDEIFEKAFETGEPINLISELKKNYSSGDIMKYKNCSSDDKNKFFVAEWIERTKETNTKVVFLTSERLAVSLLDSIKFKVHKLETDIDASKDTVHICPEEITSRLLNDIDRDKRENCSWDLFNVDVVISDKCSNDDALLTDRYTDVDVVNHSSIRGSNKFRNGNKSVLTIVSYIPNKHIKKIMDCLNSLSSDKTYTFNDVHNLFYVDRIRQAVGRTIGYRGISSNVHDAYVIINRDIYRDIFDVIANPNEVFPYSIKHWKYENVNLKNKIQEVKDKYAAYELSQKIKKQEKNRKYVPKLNSELTDLFEISNDSVLTFEEISNHVLRNIENIECIQPSRIIKLFNLKSKQSSKRVNGKPTPFKYVEGLKIKEIK